jgi:hypothetical protein
MRVHLILAFLLPNSLGLAQEIPAENTTSAPPATVEVKPAEDAQVPRGAIGIGAGWRFPGGDIQVPNVASVRFRFHSGLTLEALVHAGFELTSTDTNTERDLEISGEGLLRIPLARKGPFELPLLVGAGLSITSSTNDPDGDDNDTTTTAFGVEGVWGIGIDWFFTSRASFSMSALNPAVRFTSTSTDGPIPSTSSTNFEIAAIFEPVITAMFHLYF